MFNNKRERDREASVAPRQATVPLPAPMPRTEEPHEFAPKRHQDDQHDSEAMTRAAQAYDALRRQLDQMRENLGRQREEISHQRQRIDLLEHALAEAKNEAASYRTEADEAKAETAAWRTFFANVQAVFNQYELPRSAPKNRVEKLLESESAEAAVIERAKESDALDPAFAEVEDRQRVP